MTKHTCINMLQILYLRRKLREIFQGELENINEPQEIFIPSSLYPSPLYRNRKATNNVYIGVRVHPVRFNYFINFFFFYFKFLADVTNFAGDRDVFFFYTHEISASFVLFFVLNLI